jgi:hypothetical protein
VWLSVNGAIPKRPYSLLSDADEDALARGVEPESFRIAREIGEWLSDAEDEAHRRAVSGDLSQDQLAAVLGGLTQEYHKRLTARDPQHREFLRRAAAYAAAHPGPFRSV